MALSSKSGPAAASSFNDDVAASSSNEKEAAEKETADRLAADIATAAATREKDASRLYLQDRLAADRLAAAAAASSSREKATARRFLQEQLLLEDSDGDDDSDGEKAVNLRHGCHLSQGKERLVQCLWFDLPYGGGASEYNTASETGKEVWVTSARWEHHYRYNYYLIMEQFDRYRQACALRWKPTIRIAQIVLREVVAATTTISMVLIYNGSNNAAKMGGLRESSHSIGILQTHWR